MKVRLNLFVNNKN